jgi:dethiobiotin synthetase
LIGYFVTGTDTGVGKTFVTAAIAQRACGAGHKVLAYKPIETGCTRGADAEYVGADQEALALAAGNWQTGALRGLYRFGLPASPLVAAAAEQASIDVLAVIEAVQRGVAGSGASVVLVEGAGGWRVPITRACDMGGLALALGFPVILVARAGLGTINHTVLSLEAIERDGATCAGVVLARRPDDDVAAAESNRDQVQHRWSGPVEIFGGDPAALDRFLSIG